MITQPHKLEELTMTMPTERVDHATAQTERVDDHAPAQPEIVDHVDCSVLLLCALVMSKRERAEAETVRINSATFCKSARSLQSRELG